MTKIQKAHLERAAYIYVRQSTMSQVQHNLESQRRQYALAERPQQLGWDDVHVVDEDLGRSASGHVQRCGFEALVADVCQGQVGVVFAIEASRLARNGHEWHQLLEFCAIVETLIIDYDGIYDPKHPNDRLLLGLKGTMSEMEVATFRQRSTEAIRQKARRGEYYAYVSVGYVHLGEGRLEKDTDQHVRRTIELVLEKFLELGSARQVFKRIGVSVNTVPWSRRTGLWRGRWKLAGMPHWRKFVDWNRTCPKRADRKRPSQFKSNKSFAVWLWICHACGITQTHPSI